MVNFARVLLFNRDVLTHLTARAVKMRYHAMVKKIHPHKEEECTEEQTMNANGATKILNSVYEPFRKFVKDISNTSEGETAARAAA